MYRVLRFVLISAYLFLVVADLPTEPLHTPIEDASAEFIGQWRCPGSTRDSPRFSKVLLLDASTLAQNAIKAKLQEAQRTGQPVLIRHVDAKTRVADVAGDIRIEVKPSMVKRFDPSIFSWSGFPIQDEKILRLLSKQLPTAELRATPIPKKASGKDKVDVVLNASLKDLIMSVKTNVSGGNGYFIKLQSSNGELIRLIKSLASAGLTTGSWPSTRGQTSYWPTGSDEEPDQRYPLFLGDRLDYEMLFVQPPGMGGAHIDDFSGATYFFLRLLEGHKTVRLWPHFESSQVQDWGCAQKAWNESEASPEYYLRGAIANGFAGGRWTPRGFEYSFLNSDTEEHFSQERSCKARMQKRDPLVGRCYVEVTVKPNEELFCPSGIPHQVTTNEPSVSVTANFRFSFVADLEWYIVQILCQRVGMGLLRVGNLVARSRVSLKDAREHIIQNPKFELAKWKLLLEHFGPVGWLRNIGKGKYTEAFTVVTQVLVGCVQREGDLLLPTSPNGVTVKHMFWSDSKKSILLNPLTKGLVESYDKDGNAMIKFEGIDLAQRVLTEHFAKLYFVQQTISVKKEFITGSLLLKLGQKGIVQISDAAGNAYVAFDGIKAVQQVKKEEFAKLIFHVIGRPVQSQSQHRDEF